VSVRTDSPCQRWEAGTTLLVLVVLLTTVPNAAHAVGSSSQNRPSRSSPSGKLSAASRPAVLDRDKDKYRGERRSIRLHLKRFRLKARSGRAAQEGLPAWLYASKQLLGEGYEPQQSATSLVGRVLSREAGPTGTVAVIHPDGQIDRFRIRRTNVAFGKILVFSTKRPNRPYVIDSSHPDWDFGGPNDIDLGDSRQPPLLYLRMDQETETPMHDLLVQGLDVQSARKTALVKERTAQGRTGIRDAIDLMKAYGPGTTGTLVGAVDIDNRKSSGGASRKKPSNKEYLLRNEQGTIRIQGGRRSGGHEATVAWPGFSGMFNVTLSINHDGMPNHDGISETRKAAPRTTPPNQKEPAISWWSKVKRQLESIWQRFFRNSQTRGA